MSKYPHLTDGESFEMHAKKQILHFACCDCGLVHRIAFGVSGQNIGIAMERHSRATAQLRRWGAANLFRPEPSSKFKIIRIG